MEGGANWGASTAYMYINRHCKLGEGQPNFLRYSVASLIFSAGSSWFVCVCLYVGIALAISFIYYRLDNS